MFKVSKAFLSQHIGYLEVRVDIAQVITSPRAHLKNETFLLQVRLQRITSLIVKKMCEVRQRAAAVSFAVEVRQVPYYG